MVVIPNDALLVRKATTQLAMLRLRASSQQELFTVASSRNPGDASLIAFRPTFHVKLLTL
jgi:hypothetical protein